MGQSEASAKRFITCPETGKRIDPRFVEKHISATWPLPIDDRNAHNAGAIARIAALREAAREALR